MDKQTKNSVGDSKPVPMKLFATWEIEKSSPYCIPRLCSLTMSNLHIVKTSEPEMQSVVLAVRMQNSKRVLRSNELVVATGPSAESIDIELDLSFSLQYPHLLKGDNNMLQILLQRRKKYKNRTFLGYKTLAMGQINMAQVLQRSTMDLELDLYSENKEQLEPLVRVKLPSVTSQPVDHEERNNKKSNATGVDLSEDDEGNEDFSSNDDQSDSDTNAGDDDIHSRQKRFSKQSFRPNVTRHQGNIKQKLFAMLRKFRVNEDVLGEHDRESCEERAGAREIDYLIDELENYSDSDPDLDTISVLSTPKPKLRPFFGSRGKSDRRSPSGNKQAYGSIMDS